MNRIQWKSRRTLYLVISLVSFYLTVRIKTYEHKASVVLPETHPNDAWEFVADFSNMKLLNPTIIDFTILAESGNYDHWKYSTQYSEFLSHWPYLRNVAVAHFEVKAKPKENIYLINSVHKTCLLFGFFCLDSESEFKFSQNDTLKGALCEENISYQCPAIMSSFCRREVLFQRTAIMNNLKMHFRKKHRS
ncbi:uncharacterized protein LOC659949 isoform X2 [Tribolium castaneum]|uniref:Uncharacterized protein n=2 Tax=Tribolium castaneum TaxID=7070 RepID=A0A139WLM4_TRICA|nr:PREDICTED: uncharacterized protein LOC659949 isoform X2 [Tribolium castaneum]KYB28784.1 hypothetical protein TcasGA2_TC032474 [Tribolium castaneum]|eukprot:XP_971308.3 PREDICTED: uncharacterized protein LOC659949 isoform X2 [Tribolium castaneum]